MILIHFMTFSTFFGFNIPKDSLWFSDVFHPNDVLMIVFVGWRFFRVAFKQMWGCLRFSRIHRGFFSWKHAWFFMFRKDFPVQDSLRWLRCHQFPLIYKFVLEDWRYFQGEMTEWNGWTSASLMSTKWHRCSRSSLG